jgi:hypothetical protein
MLSPDYDLSLRLTRWLWYTVLVLFLLGLVLPGLHTFEDGSFIIRFGPLDLGGCLNPLALCAR